MNRKKIDPEGENIRNIDNHKDKHICSNKNSIKP